MPYELYKVLHVVGIVVLSVGFGGLMLARRDADGRAPRGAAALHGVGVLIVLVAGFGLLARVGIAWPWPGWVYGKVAVWLVLGALPFLARRLLPASIALIAAIALAGAAAWIAVYKPF